MAKTRIVKAFIERGRDGSYGVYFDEDLGCGFFGDGATKQEAIKDFIESYEDFRDESSNPKVRETMQNIEFDYCIDIKSYLEYYSQFFKLEGIAKLTGVSANQLSQYLNGFRTPKQSTAKKIEEGLIAFGNDLEGLKVS